MNKMVYAFNETDSAKIDSLKDEILALELSLDLKKAERDTRQVDYEFIANYCRTVQRIWSESAEPEKDSEWTVEQKNRTLFFETMKKYDFLLDTTLDGQSHSVDLLSDNREVVEYCLTKHVYVVIVGKIIDEVKEIYVSTIAKETELKALYEILIGYEL